ncbi:MAG: alcohol dehydrogenase catalytic domain-containing protein [Desulfohalobiaceae bacterium]|nr:alcohol dehydrogenase catalytic domain-containing protein [Desulfohalobiaceae bacterium]
MTAAFFRDSQIELCRIQTPSPEPGEALLRTRMSGICQTDHELLHGYQGFSGVPGHEFVADVVEAPGRRDLEGSRVVADINCGCGECPYCLGGMENHCPSRRVIGIREKQGAFADFLTAPAGNLHPLPEEMDDRRAIFAEPLAAALRITQQTHITAGMRIAVLGDGKMGLLTAMSLFHVCPEVLLMGRHGDKLDIFERVGGRTLLVEPGEDPALPGNNHPGFQLVVEATGNPEGIEQATRLCQPQGTVVLKTTAERPASFPFSRLAVQEQRILGSRCGDLDLALHYLRYGLVDPEPLIETILPWTELPWAMDRSAARGSKKVLLDHMAREERTTSQQEEHSG